MYYFFLTNAVDEKVVVVPLKNVEDDGDDNTSVSASMAFFNHVSIRPTCITNKQT